MKPFDLIYYLFILASMALSTIAAPAMFIEHRALAGWLWIGFFLILLLMLFYGAIKNIMVEGARRYETQLGTIIAWICIIGQLILIITIPTHGLLYNLSLMLMALGSVYFGWWAPLHPKKHALVSEAVDKTTAKWLSEAQKEQTINMGFALSNKLFELETEKILLESKLAATNTTISLIKESQRILRRQHG